MTTKEYFIDFATLANCLEEADIVMCESQRKERQLVAVDAFISEDGRDGFQLLISDGCDGYEMIHQFTDHGERIPLFDEGKQVLMLDDEGETVTLMILKKAEFFDAATKAHDLGFQDGLKHGVENNPFEDGMERHMYRVGYDSGVAEYCRAEISENQNEQDHDR